MNSRLDKVVDPTVGLPLGKSMVLLRPGPRSANPECYASPHAPNASRPPQHPCGPVAARGSSSAGANCTGARPHRPSASAARRRSRSAGRRRARSRHHGCRHEAACDRAHSLRRHGLGDRAAGLCRAPHYGRRPHGRARRHGAAHHSQRLSDHADARRMAGPGARRPALDYHRQQRTLYAPSPGSATSTSFPRTSAHGSSRATVSTWTSAPKTRRRPPAWG